MAESVIAQAKEGVMDVAKTPFKRPIVALVVGALVLTIVLLIESFKPGLFTNPIRSMLRAVGAKV